MFATEHCSKVGCFLEAALPGIAPAVALHALNRCIRILGHVRVRDGLQLVLAWPTSEGVLMTRSPLNPSRR